MRVIVFAAFWFVAGAACAQSGPASDQSIAEAHDICNRPNHFVPIGAMGHRPEGAGGYKPEYKASCSAIDAEYDSRGIAAAVKRNEELKRLDDIARRLK